MAPSPLPFVHLGARSDVSLGESIARVDELCWEASRDDQGFLALTDVNSLARVPAFAAAAARAGLRPVYGAELNVLPLGETQYRGLLYRVRLLVHDAMGWKTLVRLVNRARAAEGTARPPFLSMAVLLEDLRGVYVVLGGERGELTQLLRNGDFARVEAMLPDLMQYIDASYLLLELPDTRSEDGLRLAQAMRNVGVFFQLPIVAIPEVRAAHAADETALRLMQWKGEAPPRRLKDLVVPVAERKHLLTRAHAAERFRDFPEALENTLAVAQHCSAFVLPQQEKRFPIHDFCRGVDAESFIWNTAFAKATERYGDLPTRYKERLNREFREIIDAGLGNAVVSMVRLKEEMENAGVQRGPGAGLFTNSLVASLLGLTRLDPLHFELNFELSPGLMSGAFPILEFSIPGNQEGLAVSCLAKLFSGQVAPVGEWVGWKGQQALEQVATVLGRDGKWVANTMKIPAFQRAREAQKGQPGTWMPPAESAVDAPEVLAWLMARMEGRARSLRLMQGVYTFTVDPFESCVPQRQFFVGAGEDGLPISEWSSEELGALRHGRIRFAHPPLLDLIGEATALAREQGDLAYAPENTAADDVATYRLLREGRTVGIWPLEAPGVRARLRQGQPADLHSLIRLFTTGDQPVGTPDLAAILLSHVCAAIKTQRPLAFFAAALSQANGDVRRTAMLLEEVRARGIRLAPLDINICQWRWTTEREALRPGLMIVRGMTPTSGQEILDKRRELHFADLQEFISRTERSRLKVSHLRQLLRAGALDDLGETRADLARRLEVLIPGSTKRAGNGAPPDELSFFDRDAEWWVREHGGEGTPTPFDDPAARLENELRAVGYLLNESLNTEAQRWLKCARVRAVEKLTPKDQKLVGSLMGKIGIVQSDPGCHESVMVDIDGCLVRAHGRVARYLEDEALAGEPVVVTGVMARDGVQWRLEVDRLGRLGELVQRTAEGALLELDLSGVHEDNWKQIQTLLHSYPGRTPVQMKWLPIEPPRVIRSIAAARVALTPALEAGLDRFLGPDRWKAHLSPEGPAQPERNLRNMLRNLELPAIRNWLTSVTR
ncbi:PHP domain-containing protein [bacterium]|nr:PHP domain-containing protein [bacterium]